MRDWPVTVEVGRTALTPARARSLGDGSIVELDRNRNGEVDLLIGGRLIARGRLVRVGLQTGITLTEVHGFEEAPS